MAENKKEIIIRIVKNIVKTNGKKFPTYRCITSRGNWFDVKFDDKVVKPNKSAVFIVKPENWMVLDKKKKDEDGEYTIKVYNKEGKKVQILYISQLDEEITQSDPRFPDSLKYEEITEV